MTTCQIEEINAGRAYPKTCPTCGFAGKCRKGLPHPWLNDEPPAAAPTPINPTKIRVGDEIEVRHKVVDLTPDGRPLYMAARDLVLPTPESILRHIPAARPIEVGDRVSRRHFDDEHDWRVIDIEGNRACLKTLRRGLPMWGDERLTDLTRVDGEVA